MALQRPEPGRREGPRDVVLHAPRAPHQAPPLAAQKAGDSAGSAAFYVNECASCDVTAHIRPNMGVSPPLGVGHASWAGRAGTRLHPESGMEGGCLSQSEKEEVAGACSLSGGPTRRDSLTHHPALPVGCQERQPAEVTHAVREEEEENSVGTRGPRSGTSGASGWIPS